MKGIFDEEARAGLVSRIENINEANTASWGKMNVYQMVKHNTYWNGWIQGLEKPPYKQEFLGRIFGKLALRKMIKDEKPFDRNIPTSAQFKVKELTCDLENEKKLWISLTAAYESFDNPNFIHDFFGRMSKEQIGILVYKHTDHHLRQFGL